MSVTPDSVQQSFISIEERVTFKLGYPGFDMNSRWRRVDEVPAFDTRFLIKLVSLQRIAVRVVNSTPARQGGKIDLWILFI